MAGMTLALAAWPASGQPAGNERSDAQVYFDAEFSLRRAEVEADCLGVWMPTALHRAIDLRGQLRALRRFADREVADFARWERAFRSRDREQLCISDRAIAENLRQAERDIRLLRLRARRADRPSVRRGN